MESSKKPWFSKTILLGVVTALAPFVPGVSEWLAANIGLVSVVWGALAVVLRLLTKDKIQLQD